LRLSHFVAPVTFRNHIVHEWFCTTIAGGSLHCSDQVRLIDRNLRLRLDGFTGTSAMTGLIEARSSIGRKCYPLRREQCPD